MHSQLAVVMFADIVGYSAMMEQDQTSTVRRVRSLRDDFLWPVVDTHNGVVLKSLGDGWIISFTSVSACVDCATAFQKRVQAGAGVKLRIGCHIGEIVRDEDEVYGSGLNIAQRIESEAPPGGFMVSEDVYRQMSSAQARQLEDAGTFRLKNIAQPVRLYQWRPARAAVQKSGDATSIAMAPIHFAPQDGETEALAGDLREQLLIRMSRRAGVVVYDAGDREVENATYDLRSRLRVAGGRGRLSLTLVLRSDGRPIWSQNYEGQTGDVFEFCDVVLEQAEADLRLQTNAFDGDRLAHIPDQDLSVSELRARAANCYYRVAYDEWLHGRQLMQRAVDMNPDDGVALAMRAEAELMLWGARYANIPDDLTRTLSAELDHAVEQAPNSDYTFWTRCLFRIDCLGNIAGARADLERSRQINPAYVENHEAEAHIRMYEEDFAGAADRFSRLLEHQSHNPLRPYRLFLRSVANHCAEQFEQAAADVQGAIDLRPQERGLHMLQAIIAEACGEGAVLDQARSRIAQLPPRPAICSRRPILPASQRALSDKLADAVRTVNG